MQFHDKTVYVWGLRHRWDSLLLMNPVRRFVHFMPPCLKLRCQWASNEDKWKGKSKTNLRLKSKAKRVPEKTWAGAARWHWRWELVSAYLIFGLRWGSDVSLVLWSRRSFFGHIIPFQILTKCFLFKFWLFSVCPCPRTSVCHTQVWACV